MAEVPFGINRKSIEASDWDTAYWLPRFHELTDGPFMSDAHRNDYRGTLDLTEVDHAMHYLYTDLGDASDGQLEIPSQLEVDQIEDWFISRAVAKGIKLKADITEMNARFRQHEQS